MADSWYYSRGGQSQGPVTWAQLQQFAASGGLAASDLVWTEGMAAWLPASQVPDLFGAPPPPAYGQPQQQYQQYPQQGAPINYQAPMPMGGMQQPNAADADLSGLDWALVWIPFCAAIGCIVGIVYLCMGKPKGGKMIGFSILSIVIWNIISFIIRAAMH